MLACPVQLEVLSSLIGERYIEIMRRKANVIRGGNEARFLRIVSSHLFRYPLMQSVDLYKLLYQAAMGSAHSVNDIEEARERLYGEMEGLVHGPPEPMLDIISADGAVARINLRPYLAAEGDPESLLKAFLITTEEFRGSGAKLDRYCEWISMMVREHLLPQELSDVDVYLKEMSSSNYPAVHHSSIYRSSYSPAYRVILSELAGQLSIFPGEAPNLSLR